MKIIIFMLLSMSAFAQDIVTNKTLILKNDLYKVLESKISIIESINGRTWVCYPKDDLIITGQKIVLVDGFPVIYSGAEKSLTLPDKKCDLVQLDFKTKKKTLIKDGSYKSCLGFPKDAGKKVKEELKNIEKHKKAKE